MPLPDFLVYGEIVYSLPEDHPSIQRSTLVLATIGRTLAKVEGQVTFEGDYLLDVWELLDLNGRRILKYSYEAVEPARRSSGTIRSSTRTCPNWPAPILITSTSCPALRPALRKASSTTGFRRRASALRKPTYPS